MAEISAYLTTVVSEEQIQQNLVSAINDPNIPKFYMNGFNVGQSLSDIFVAMNLTGSVVGIINMSFTTAKTLMVALQEAIVKFEQQTGQELLTMHDVRERTQKVEPKQ